jgi:hypothetical protein
LHDAPERNKDNATVRVLHERRDLPAVFDEDGV